MRISILSASFFFHRILLGGNFTPPLALAQTTHFRFTPHLQADPLSVSASRAMVAFTYFFSDCRSLCKIFRPDRIPSHPPIPPAAPSDFPEQRSQTAPYAPFFAQPPCTQRPWAATSDFPTPSWISSETHGFGRFNVPPL